MISGERLQDHWSSGLKFMLHVFVFGVGVYVIFGIHLPIMLLIIKLVKKEPHKLCFHFRS